MLPELHKAFPGNLAMQSLGSFDTDRSRDAYRRHSTMAGNDLAQVHRYLASRRSARDLPWPDGPSGGGCGPGADRIPARPPRPARRIGGGGAKALGPFK